MGLIQGQLLRGDDRMVTQMVRADLTFKFWSQTLGCVSLKDIFRETEIENTETDTFFSFSPTHTLSHFRKKHWNALLCYYYMKVLKKA